MHVNLLRANKFKLFVCLLKIIPCVLSAQNVGIGTTTPLQKLHIFNGSAGASGSRAPVVVESNSNTYINILSPTNGESAIHFGRGTDFTSGGIVYNNFASNSGMQFRTAGNVNRMVLSNTGFLGIGNLTPGFILDVSGRGRIRSGGDDATSAGWWLNNNAQALTAFIGMETDNYVGLYSSKPGVGWKFSMNVNTGALKVNGAEGVAGQVLQSNGTSSAPTWSSGSKVLYNNLINISSAVDHTIFDGDPAERIGTFAHTFTLTGNAKVLVNFHLEAFYSSCLCTFATTFIHLVVNGSNVHFYHYAIPNYGVPMSLQGTHLLSLSPGTYTVELKGRQTGASNVMIETSANRSNFFIQIVPE